MIRSFSAMQTIANKAIKIVNMAIWSIGFVFIVSAILVTIFDDKMPPMTDAQYQQWKIERALQNE